MGRLGLVHLIRAAAMLPMLGMDVVKGQQRLAILGQAGARLLVFRPVLGKEAIKGLLGAGTALGMIDLMQIALGLLLH